MAITETKRLDSHIDLIKLIGGPKSQYYHACYQIVKVMIIGDGEKRKTCLLHGTAGSGKTRIARYTGNIFETHWKNECKGIFDEKILREEAHKQLLIYNEANMYQLFSKANLPQMKKLMEGLGISLNVKYAHSFTGFIGANLLMTCNALCYPWIEPSSSHSGFTKDDFNLDHGAMYDRAKVIKFTKKFVDTGLCFNEV